MFGEKKTERLLDYIDAEQLEQEFGGTREAYPCPDELCGPLFEGAVALVGLQPYDYISWVSNEKKVEEVVAPSPSMNSTVSFKSKGGDEGFSDYEDDDADAQPVSQISNLNVSSSSAREDKKKKSRSLRKTIGRMFSARSKKPFESESSDSKDEDLPQPSVAESFREDRPVEVIPVKPRPRIAVFGATGKTGKALILELLDQNNDVTAFVRVNGSKLSPDLVQRSDSTDPKKPRLTIVVGDVTSLLDLERVVEDCDGVVCAMGVVPALSGSSCEFLPAAISHIMDAMEKLKVRRFVVVSSAHASQNWWEQGAGLISNLTKPIYWKNHYQYIATMEDEIRTRGTRGAIDYTIVRPGTLVDGPLSPAIRVEEGFVFPDIGAGELTRMDLVKFLTSEVLDTKAASKYCGKGVAIGKN